MPKYYFHLREHNYVTFDHDGVPLADVAAASARALSEAKGMLAAELCDGDTVNLDRRIEVFDEAGSAVHILPFESVLQIMRPRSAPAHQIGIDRINK